MKKFDFKKIASRVAGVAAGSITGEVAAAKIAPNMNPMIKGLALVGIGAVTPEMSKNALVGSFGDGLVAAGAAQIARKAMPNLFAPPAPPVEGIGEAETTFVTDDAFSVVTGNAEGLAGDDDLILGIGNEESDSAF